MEVFVITESYQDYKTADATTHGIYKTMKDAKMAFRNLLEEMFDYMFDEEDEDSEEWIMANYIKNTEDSCMWVYDDGDSIYKFYIEKINANI